MTASSPTSVPGLSLLLAFAFLAAVARAQTPLTGPAAAPPEPSAEAYYRWLVGCLDAIEKDMPRITASAEAAAKAYVQEGWEIGTWGDAGMVGEFNSRAGGMMRTSQPREIERESWKGIVLFFPREDSWGGDLEKAAALTRQGKIVIGFFGAKGFASLAESDRRLPVAEAIRTHSAPRSGLFPGADANDWLVPTEPVAGIAALWTWTGEFIGALTRLGKMPAMHQSIMVPGAMARMEKYKGLRFHAEAPQKVAAGALGREYLAEVGKALASVRQKEMGKIEAVAKQAAAAIRAGRKAHVFAHGHAVRYHVEVPHDLGFFHQVNRGLFELKDEPGIAKGDFVFCVGYDRVFEGWYFHDAMTRMRAAGATMAWSMTDYNNKLDANIAPSSLPKGEIVINQYWDLGDCVATVPGYDVKILPPSGVLAEAILYMTEAEMLRILGPKPAASAPATKP